MSLKKIYVACVAAVAVSACSTVIAKPEVNQAAVVKNYSDIAYAAFSDSLTTAQALQKAVDAFIAQPSKASQDAAKQAWLAARIPYGQTEVFRFGNANVDDWEGKVNAWPLDEGLIDYVVRDYENEDGNNFGRFNIVANGKQTIDAALLESFHEKGGSEANVATGYHAVEFMLWGQDLNAAPGDSGSRAYTDFAKGSDCSKGNCDRRAAYLKTATDLLVSDLREMVVDWAPGSNDNYRANLAKDSEALKKMLFGMGSLSLGELAGERINVALIAESQEDEHSCFSDNTHMDIWANAKGIQNVYLGDYSRVDGSKIDGPGLSGLVVLKNANGDAQLQAALETTMDQIAILVESAKTEHFDQQILFANKAGKKRIRAVIGALKAQTLDIMRAAESLGIKNLKPDSSDSFGG